MIDYRSDTFTKPTPMMLEAMFKAEVGDDVFGEDPTVNQLEAFSSRYVRDGSGFVLPKRHDDQPDRD